MVPNRQQAIIWTNADPVDWRIYAALGGDESVQERRNSSALAMELHFSCTNPSMYGLGIFFSLTDTWKERPSFQTYNSQTSPQNGAINQCLDSISTHCHRDKMDVISQTTLSNKFSWLKMLKLRLKFHSMAPVRNGNYCKSVTSEHMLQD